MVGAYFLVHLRERGRAWATLFWRLLAYALLVRFSVTLLMIAATTYGLGSHYDLSGFTAVQVPVLGGVYGFEPGSLRQIAYLGAIPQLTFYVGHTVVTGLLGAGRFAVVAGARQARAPVLRRPAYWRPASQDR